MTILGYWAARDFPALGPRRFLYPVGSGTLGYAWPAAIGAAVAEPETRLWRWSETVVFMYSLAELASARQAGVNTTVLVVDDGGYGILREYQRSAYGETWGVDLVAPDFLALAKSFGVDAPRDQRRRAPRPTSSGRSRSRGRPCSSSARRCGRRRRCPEARRFAAPLRRAGGNCHGRPGWAAAAT